MFGVRPVRLFIVRIRCVASADALILNARSAILPGVGTFGAGMEALRKTQLDHVIREFIESGRKFPSETGDTKFFDAFDHLVTGLLNQAEDDTNFGIPFELGPVKDRIYEKGKVHHTTVAHPTIAHPTLPRVAENEV